MVSSEPWPDMITTGRSGRARLLEDGQPIQVGHADVHDDRLDGERGDLLERLAAAARDLHGVSLHRERAGEGELDVPLVVDDEHGRGHGVDGMLIPDGAREGNPLTP